MNYKIAILLITSIFPNIACASGGYDNGTPAGEGKLDIEITLNPGDIVDKGQSYIVWGYGLTNTLDFHGYVSHEAGGSDQIYYGLMYNCYSNATLDLSTAIGARHRQKLINLYAPQLLYTIRLFQDYDVIGSMVNVYDTDQNLNRGITYDIAFRIPFKESLTPSFIKDAKLAIGAFRGLSGNIYPTYSIDLRF